MAVGYAVCSVAQKGAKQARRIGIYCPLFFSTYGETIYLNFFDTLSENQGAAAAGHREDNNIISAGFHHGQLSTSIDNADVGRYRGKEGNVYRITDAFPNKSNIDSESPSPRLLRTYLFCLFRERTL